MEKSSSDQSLEIVIDSAKAQNTHAMEKYEEVILPFCCYSSLSCGHSVIILAI